MADDVPKRKERPRRGNQVWNCIQPRKEGEADYQEFANIIGQRNLSHRTKSIWYPVLDKKAHSLMRYIDEDDIMDTERMTVLKDDEIVSVSDTPPALVALDIE